MGVGDPHICYGFDYRIAVVREPSCVAGREEVLPLSEGDVVVEVVFVFETGADAGTVTEARTTVSGILGGRYPVQGYNAPVRLYCFAFCMAAPRFLER